MKKQFWILVILSLFILGCLDADMSKKSKKINKIKAKGNVTVIEGMPPKQVYGLVIGIITALTGGGIFVGKRYMKSPTQILLEKSLSLVNSIDDDNMKVTRTRVVNEVRAFKSIIEKGEK